MRLRFYKTLWGMEALPVEERVAKVAEAGYDGFEGVMPDVLEARRRGSQMPAVGMIFPQPRLADGRLMDEAIGQRFAIVGETQLLASARPDAVLLPGVGADWLARRGVRAAAREMSRKISVLRR